jgi:transposase-like protein
MEENESKGNAVLDAKALKDGFYRQIRELQKQGRDVPADFAKQLLKGFYEAVLQAEISEHLGYEKHELAGRGSGNSRNGSSEKTIRGEFGEVEIDIPRDRQSEFEPRIIKKHETSVGTFDEAIISLYARGMTTREIEAHLKEIYGVDVSPSLISRATDKVNEDVVAWQNRPLQALYTVLYLDGIRFNVRDNTSVKNLVVYIALGVDVNGHQEVLGLWHADNEGAAFWMNVCAELKARGVQDVLIACVDGLKGLPEAIAATFPKVDVQLCVVHLIRNSCRFLSFKDRKAFCADLKDVYCAPTAQAAEAALAKLEERWGQRYPASIRVWKDPWDKVITFLRYPPELRRAVYTTNSIEALNAYLRKNTKNRRLFPSIDALMKILYLNVRKASEKWKFRKNWDIVTNQLVVLFGDRIALDAFSYGPKDESKYAASSKK